MDKYEFITELMELFDAMDALKRENEELKSAIFRNACDDAEEQPKGKFIMLDHFAIQIGREQLYKDNFYSWKECRAYRNDAGEIVTTPYDEWLEEKQHSTPDCISKLDFLEYMSPVLIRKYDQEKAEALQDLRRNESNEEKGA